MFSRKKKRKGKPKKEVQSAVSSTLVRFLNFVCYHCNIFLYLPLRIITNLDFDARNVSGPDLKKFMRLFPVSSEGSHLTLVIFLTEIASSFFIFVSFLHS